MTGAPLLSVEDLTIHLPGGPELVRDVSFTLRPGGRLALVGESGSGKTLTARAVAGLLPSGLAVARGSIRFDGRALTGLDPESWRREIRPRIGVVFQESTAALNPRLRILDQLGEAVDPEATLPRAEREARARDLLDQVRMPRAALSAHGFPHELSGGMNQRVGIAMALARRPALLIADEATTALDTTTQAQILRLIRDLCAQNGTGLILISHDLGLVQDHAEQIHVMRNGEIVEAGPTGPVLSQPAHAYTRMLLEATPALLMRQPDLSASPRTTSPQTLDYLRAEGVLRSYSRRGGPATAAVKSVSISVARGEAVGLVGESGSGKSTLSRLLAGLEAPDAGRITIDGQEIWRKRALIREWRPRVQMVFQDPLGSLDPYMAIAESIEQPLIVSGLRNAAARARKVAAVLDEVGLPRNLAARRPRQLSGGQRQRAGIARALVLDPQILLADEPVSALDVSVQARVIELLRQLQRERGLTMLLVTHDLAVVRLLTSRIYIIQHGEIVEHGPTAAVLENPTHPHARDLVRSIPGRAALALTDP